ARAGPGPTRFSSPRFAGGHSAIPAGNRTTANYPHWIRDAAPGHDDWGVRERRAAGKRRSDRSTPPPQRTPQRTAEWERGQAERDPGFKAIVLEVCNTARYSYRYME